MDSASLLKPIIRYSNKKTKLIYCEDLVSLQDIYTSFSERRSTDSSKGFIETHPEAKVTVTVNHSIHRPEADDMSRNTDSNKGCIETHPEAKVTVTVNSIHRPEADDMSYAMSLQQTFENEINFEKLKQLAIDQDIARNLSIDQVEEAQARLLQIENDMKFAKTIEFGGK